MSIRKSHFLVPSLSALLLLAAGCETASARKPLLATPSNQAIAPTLAVLPVSAAVMLQNPLPQPDPIDALVAEAEREYQAGRANYEAGELEKAKDNFDRAFNLLTEGPVDIRSDERLEREFDRIVEGTHELELEALKEG